MDTVDGAQGAGTKGSPSAQTSIDSRYKWATAILAGALLLTLGLFGGYLLGEKSHPVAPSAEAVVPTIPTASVQASSPTKAESKKVNPEALKARAAAIARLRAKVAHKKATSFDEVVDAASNDPSLHEMLAGLFLEINTRDWPAVMRRVDFDAFKQSIGQIAMDLPSIVPEEEKKDPINALMLGMLLKGVVQENLTEEGFPKMMTFLASMVDSSPKLNDPKDARPPWDCYFVGSSSFVIGSILPAPNPNVYFVLKRDQAMAWKVVALTVRKP